MCTYIYIYIWTYTHTYVYMYIYIYVHMYIPPKIQHLDAFETHVRCHHCKVLSHSTAGECRWNGSTLLCGHPAEGGVFGDEQV